MSQEAAPEQAVPQQPKGLLQQMEELMAALNADLSQLDADLQAGTDVQAGTEVQPSTDIQSTGDRPPTAASGGTGG
ncbi:hypothetical protein [Streptomyces sp. ISL-100]|uniref:hypothetical protein n=1 Tax=Streptomyces sp. ISL-100 TaxID=2819173 RepID=UPI001BE8E693|nr:hypothetical protein [Streptomyces sp. ISL-100]MBT2396938.1 hypothetical protein [Streptomyces sp. ISL-100]